MKNKNFIYKIFILLLIAISVPCCGQENKFKIINLTPQKVEPLEIEKREIEGKDLQFKIINEKQGKTYLFDFIYDRNSGFKRALVNPSSAYTTLDKIKERNSDRFKFSQKVVVNYDIIKDLKLPFEIKVVFWEESNPNATTENIIRIVEERTRNVSIENLTFEPLIFEFGEIDVSKGPIVKPLKISWNDFPNLKNSDFFYCELSVDDITGQTKIKRDVNDTPVEKTDITITPKTGIANAYITIRIDQNSKPKSTINKSTIKARLIPNKNIKYLQVKDNDSQVIIPIKWELKEEISSFDGILILFIFVIGTGFLVGLIWFLINKGKTSKKSRKEKSDTGDYYSKGFDEGIATPISDSIPDKKSGVSYEKDTPFLKVVPQQIDLPSQEFNQARVIRNEWYGPIKITIEANYSIPFKIECYGRDDRIILSRDQEFYPIKYIQTQYANNNIHKSFYIWVYVFKQSGKEQSVLNVEMIVKRKRLYFWNKKNETVLINRKVSCHWNIDEIDRLEKFKPGAFQEVKPTGQMVSAEQEQIKLDSTELRLIKYIRQNQITLAQIDHWQESENFYEMEMQRGESQKPEEKNRIQRFESKINELHQENVNYRGQLQTYEKKFQEFENEIKQKDDIIKSRDQKIRDLEGHLSIAQKDLDVARLKLNKKEQLVPEKIQYPSTDEKRTIKIQDGTLSKISDILNDIQIKFAEETRGSLPNTINQFHNIIRDSNGVDLQNPNSSFHYHFVKFQKERIVPLIEFLLEKKDDFSRNKINELAKNTSIQLISPAEGDAYDDKKHEAKSFLLVEPAQKRTVLKNLRDGLELNGEVVLKARVQVGE